MRADRYYLTDRYRAAFKICLELRDYRKAAEYARKDLELTYFLIGTDDTEYLCSENRGEEQFKYWYRHLRELREIY